MAKRISTSYPGVFFRQSKRIGHKGTEKIFYVLFKKDGKLIEEKAGRQFADGMTAAKAAAFRGERIEGKRPSRKEIREARIAAKQAAEQADAARWTVDRLWQEYKAQKADIKALAKDQIRFRRYIQPAFGERQPRDILPLDIDRLRINLLKKLTPKTVSNVMELLKRIINFGVKRQLCDQLSFTMTMPKVNNLRTEDLSPEQMQRLLDAIAHDGSTEIGDLMRLALFSGMRRGELLKLKWDDLDFDRRFIRIVDPKGGPDQIIPMNDGALDVLANHPRTDSPFVFPGRDGKQRVGPYGILHRIRKAAGLPQDFRPLHGLRHAYASMLASSGKVDLYTLQKLLTHKTPQMTMRYAHLRDEALRRAANVASDLITQAVNGKKKEAEKQTA